MPNEPNPTPEAVTVPATSVEAEPEQIKEVFHEILGLKNRFKKLRSFFRTRKQIKSGADLFDKSADELKSKGLMGPLTFNIYASSLAGTVALVVTKVASFVWPAEASSPSDRTLSAVSKQYLSLLPSAESYLKPFVVPIGFLLIAYLISWGTVRRQTTSSISSEVVDWTGRSRRRGRNAFLYFDGAFGFIPQAILAVAFTVLKLEFLMHPWMGLTSPDPASVSFGLDYPFLMISLSLCLLLGVTILYIAYLTYYKFPKLIFTAHGYYPAGKKAELRNEAKKPPWAKYILTAIFIVPAVSTLTIVLYEALASGLAWMLAVVVTIAHGKLFA